MGAAAIDEVREMFGVVPMVFQRMADAGTLEQHWPGISALYRHPEPLPKPVLEALLAALALRCSRAYCFVYHSLNLAAAGAERHEIRHLGRLLAVPPLIPEHERWSRVVRLAWLAEAEGPHQSAAAHALARACSPDELRQVRTACTVAALLETYVHDHQLDVRYEPGIANLPDELRLLVPEFIQFHTNAGRLIAGRSGQLPVACMCSSCKAIRATDDQWYPFAAAVELLPEDALFSHGLCGPCLQELQ